MGYEMVWHCTNMLLYFRSIEIQNVSVTFVLKHTLYEIEHARLHTHTHAHTSLDKSPLRQNKIRLISYLPCEMIYD